MHVIVFFLVERACNRLNFVIMNMMIIVPDRHQAQFTGQIEYDKDVSNPKHYTWKEGASLWEQTAKQRPSNPFSWRKKKKKSTQQRCIICYSIWLFSRLRSHRGVDSYRALGYIWFELHKRRNKYESASIAHDINYIYDSLSSRFTEILDPESFIKGNNLVYSSR